MMLTSRSTISLRISMGFDRLVNFSPSSLIPTVPSKRRGGTASPLSVHLLPNTQSHQQRTTPTLQEEMAIWDLSLSLATALSVITEFIHVTRAWNTILERSKGKTLLYHLVSFFPSNSFRWDRDISPLDFKKKYLFLRERKRVCVWWGTEGKREENLKQTPY